MKLKDKISEYKFEAGLDEAGRGCLAGPVTAAAVILPNGFKNSILTDSKALSEKQRNKLRPIIEEESVAWAVAHVSPLEIDEHNILQASFIAMHRALDQLLVKPEFLAIDGNRFKAYADIPHQCEIKGDGRFLNIAAASILAKTHRDEAMEQLDLEFPQYNWKKNKGYPTKAHRMAIVENGSTKHHRLSFTLLPSAAQVPKAGAKAKKNKTTNASTKTIR